MKSKLILAAAILLPFLYIIHYIWSTTGNIVFRDDMYLIKGGVVERFCEGSLAFNDLWRAAAMTRLFGYNLLLIANAAWFGLNSRLVVLLAPLFLLASACLIYRDYRKSLAGLFSPALIAGTYALPMLLLFNVTLWEGLTFDFGIIFVWSVPWFLASFCELEDLLINGRAISWLGATIVPSVAILVFGQTASFPFGAAVAITFGCYLILNRQKLPRGFLLRMLGIGSLLVLLVFLYLYRIYDNDYFPGSQYQDWRVFAEGWSVVRFILATLAASVARVDVAESHLSFAVVVGLGVLVAVGYALALVLYFSKRMHERTYLPLFMIAYALAFVAFMTVGRLEFGVQYGMASRYTCNTIYGIIAIVWIFIYVLAGAPSLVRVSNYALGAALILIFAGLSWTSLLEWRLQPFRKEHFRRLQAVALHVDAATRGELSSFEERPSLVRESLRVLRKYRLNVFRNSVLPHDATDTPLPVSAMQLALPAGGASRTSTPADAATAESGYATLECDADNVPYGTAVFKLLQDQNVISEAAVPAATTTTRVLAYIDYRSGVTEPPGSPGCGSIGINTGIAIANPGGVSARIAYTLRDMEGRTLAAGQGMMAPNSHIARSLHQLAEVAPGFKLPASSSAVPLFGSLEIASDQPISVAGLRQTTNEKHKALITATPIADLGRTPSENPIYIPQFVDGGGYSTSLILLNTSDLVETGAFQILDDSGAALRVRPIDGTEDSTFGYSIKPDGVFRFKTDGSSPTMKVGWVRMVPDGNSPVPLGMGLFSYRQGCALMTESGIAAAFPTTHARIFVDKSAGYDAGLAIANPSAVSTSITLNAFRADGSTPADGGAPGVIRLEGNGHSAKMVGEVLTGLSGDFAGVVDVSSRVPFVALTLRVFARAHNEFTMTAFPVADFARKNRWPVVFPHIADGGGYATELIFLNVGPPVRAKLKFLDETGMPFVLGK